MAKQAIDVKGIEKNLEASDIFLFGGKKQIVVDDYDVKKGTVAVGYRAIGKFGNLSKKEYTANVNDPAQLLPIRGRLTTTASITETALKRAMNAWLKANQNDTGASGTTVKSEKQALRAVKRDFSGYARNLKLVAKSDDSAERKELKAENRKALRAITKAGYGIRDEENKIVLFTKLGALKSMKTVDIMSRRTLTAAKATRTTKTTKTTKAAKSTKAAKTSAKAKVYVVLRKEKKVVAAKVLKDTRAGAKCSFRLDGEVIERSIREQYMFDTRTEARESLAELKGGKTSRQKAPAKKTKAEAADKVFIMLKAHKKVVVGKRIKESANGKKARVTFKDPAEGEVVTKTVSSAIIFESRPEARAALRSIGNGKAGKTAASKTVAKASGRKAKAKATPTCGMCKHRNTRKNDCPWYDSVYEDSDICDDGHYKAK
jgi:hypothetical protein